MKRRKFKQHNLIGIRAITDHREKRHVVYVSIACVIAFVCMFIFTWFTSSMIVHASAEDYSKTDDISMQLTFTGDTTIARYIEGMAEKNGYELLFENIEGIWNDSDYVFTNLEYVVLTDDIKNYTVETKTVTLSGTTDSVDALVDAGVNVFSIANNHTSDFGSKGFFDELEYLAKNNLNFSGYYLSESHMPTYSDSIMDLYNSFDEQPYLELECDNGVTIGYLAVVSPHTSETSLLSSVLKTSNSDVYEYINKSARNTDLTVVYLHGGVENTLSIDSREREEAEQMIDAGADIVIACHSHVLLPVEKYKDGIIFYSLGNFIMDQTFYNERDSVIVQYNVTDDGYGYFELIPLRITNGYTHLANNKACIKRINRMMTMNLDEDDYYEDENGHIIILWAKEGGLS